MVAASELELKPIRAFPTLSVTTSSAGSATSGPEPSCAEDREMNDSNSYHILFSYHLRAANILPH